MSAADGTELPGVNGTVEPDRSTLLLGITSFLQQNLTLYRTSPLAMYLANMTWNRLEYFAILHPDIDLIDNDNDPEYLHYHDAIQKLYKVKPTVFRVPPPRNSAEYIKHGEMAEKRGVALNVFGKTYDDKALAGIDLLPPCDRETWSLYEGTIDPEVFENRYYVLATWYNHSCATDAVLFVGIYSKAAVQRVDTIPLSEFRQLSPVQRKFRAIMCLPWGKMTQEERDGARNEWRKLSLEDSISVKERGLDLTKPMSHPVNTQQDVRDIVRQCFHDLPSFTCTVRPAHTCCGQTYRVRRETQAFKYRVWYFGMSDTCSIGEKLSDVFRKERCSESPERTCRKNCGKPIARVTLVLDRLPPMQAVCLAGEVRLNRADDCKFFDDISIRYYTARGTCVKRYIVVAVIFCVGTAQDHFISRYKGRGEYRGQLVEYNSLSSSAVSCVASWTAGMKGTDSVRVVFYRQHKRVLTTLAEIGT
jgi:hypothetical protein